MTTPIAVHRRIDDLMREYEAVFNDPWPNAEMYEIPAEQQLVLLKRSLDNRRPYQNTKPGVDY